jgi:hypothetical protein
VDSKNYCTDAAHFFLDLGDSFDLPSSSDQGSEFKDEDDDYEDNEAIGDDVAPALPITPTVHRTSSFQYNVSQGSSKRALSVLNDQSRDNIK